MDKSVIVVALIAVGAAGWGLVALSKPRVALGDKGAADISNVGDTPIYIILPGSGSYVVLPHQRTLIYRRDEDGKVTLDSEPIERKLP